MNVRTRIGLGAATAGAGYVVTTQPSNTQLMLLGIALLAGVVLGWRRYGRTSAQVVRGGERARRKHGVASTLDILRYGSAWTVRRKARVVRPSLRQLSLLARLRLPTSQVGVELCRVGPLSVWVSTEDNVIVFGGPRKGKTGYLVARVIDAPGAVISTSTRRDLMDATQRHRATGGRPVWLYNPAGLGGDELRSTLAYDPLVGCADPRRAVETATDMIPADGGGDAERWNQQARRVLGVLMHAAALEGLPISVVAEWVADPDAAAPEVLSALRRSPDLAHVQIARQFVGTNDRTRSSITSSIMPALAWLTAPEAVAALSGGTQLNVAELVAARGTVYLLGRHESHTAGLLAALTGRIVRDARALAAHQPGGRLDPPLMLALDEAARIAPIDIPDLSGDCGGSGITLIPVFQSRADVTDRWGASGAARLLTNCSARLLFGGAADAAELKAWSDLAGERDEKGHNHDKDGKRSGHNTHKVPVLSFAQLAKPGNGRVTVFSHNMPPLIGRVRMGWDRRPSRLTRWRANAAPGVSRPVSRPSPASPTSSPASPGRSPVHPGGGSSAGASVERRGSVTASGES